MSYSEVVKCKYCGAPGRVRYRRPTWFVECKKCANRTRYYSDFYEEADTESKALAIEEWNKNNKEEPK